MTKCQSNLFHNQLILAQESKRYVVSTLTACKCSPIPNNFAALASKVHIKKRSAVPITRFIYRLVVADALIAFNVWLVPTKFWLWWSKHSDFLSYFPKSSNDLWCSLTSRLCESPNNCHPLQTLDFLLESPDGCHPAQTPNIITPRTFSGWPEPFWELLNYRAFLGSQNLSSNLSRNDICIYI